MKKELLYLLSLLFIQGCSSVSNTEPPCVKEIKLQLKEEICRMNLSEIVDSIIYIPLETTEGSLLGDIDRIVITEAGEYLIADKEIASAVFLFTSEGNFIRRIGDKGDGPKEYIKIEDVAYYNHKVYIWDSASRKILEYNMDGELLNIYRFDYTAYYFSCIEDKKFAFFCDYAHNSSLSNKGKLPNLLEYNAESEDCTSDLFFDERIPSQAYLLSLNNLSENILYTSMGDTIYDVSSNEVKRKYVLDYPKIYKKNKKDYFDGFSNKKITTNYTDEKKFPVLVSCFTCDLIDVFFIRLGKYLHYAFYFPELGICKEASAMNNPIVDDIDNAVSFFLRYAKGDALYSVLEPDALIESNPIIAQQMNVKNDDNLIIVKMLVKR